MCTTTEPLVCFQIPPQSHHLLPVCCCWRCHVTCQLFCTVHDVSSLNGKKIGSCCRCSFPSGFGRAQNLSCPISGCSFMPNFPNNLFSTMPSVLSRTSSLLSWDTEIVKDVKLDAPVSRMIATACFHLLHKISRLHRANRAFYLVSSPPSTFLVRPATLSSKCWLCVSDSSCSQLSMNILQSEDSSCARGSDAALSFAPICSLSSKSSV